MAQTLSSYQPTNSAVGTLDEAKYKEFLARYDEAEERVRAAVAERKDLRSLIAATGVPMKAWDDARRDGNQSGEERQQKHDAYLVLMAWQGKPVGLIDVEPPPLTVADLKMIDTQGLTSGRTGQDRGKNPYTPGTEQYQRWDTAWLRGQGERSGAASEEPRRRGRPPGSKNRPKQPELTVHEGGASAEDDPGSSDTRH